MVQVCEGICVKNCFINSINVEETLTLIQGPPGTGKTVTASRIIQQWLQHFPENKVQY